jgi:alkylation response protein AidB-like acyl-CoA dehydrogenase
LASLQTRAVRDGDEYVINGQKMFCTFAHYATHLWLLARTDPDAPKHKGCSLFLFPINIPGISVRPIYTMSGFRTNEVFLDNVRVPTSSLIGQENRGFHHVMVALDFERISGGPGLRRELDELIQFCKEFRVNGVALFDDPVVQDRLVRLHIETELVRLFTHKIAWMIENGLVPSTEASAQKIWGSELRQRFANEALQLMGMYGQLRRGSHRAPFNGRYLVSWLSSPLGRFGAGTNEIQRDIIAQRGLGLPRA